MQTSFFSVSPSNDEEVEFWNRFSSGRWEPDTLTNFERFITPDTTVLDVGAWIGPTALYAARLAKKVYAFEPDPSAFAALETNLRMNPTLPVEALNVCVAREAGELIMGANAAGRGSSGSSILHAENSDSWRVPAIRLHDFIRDRKITGHIFLKIDIEGYEYQLLPPLLRELRGLDVTLHLSTHPHILWESIGANSLAQRLARRWRMIRLQAALLYSLLPMKSLADGSLAPLSKRHVARAVLGGTSVTKDRVVIAATARPM